MSNNLPYGMYNWMLNKGLLIQCRQVNILNRMCCYDVKFVAHH